MNWYEAYQTLVRDIDDWAHQSDVPLHVILDEAKALIARKS